MALIFETENFILESHERPEISREEGGHIKISPKKKISDRSELNPKEAIEFMRLSIVSGIAMKKAMRKNGIQIDRINYQDNGNWKANFHLHLYGRAVGAKMQKLGEPIIPGHKKEYQSLNEKEILDIKTEIEILFSLEKYSNEKWRLF
ncbi:MAG: HIT domain-containing protein [Nanoarchaeota archaeon]|nr:HIT domain-containing protein [Nanoarchaeota archaeon]